MTPLFADLAALFQVIMIDVSLSGDNAVVIGMAAAGLEEKQRKRAIFFGIILAILIRIIVSIGTVQVLNLPYLALVGGALLLWVCWKMFKDLQGNSGEDTLKTHHKSIYAAILQIIVADASMSLDNVLAVAAAARDHIIIMGFGLLLSIGFMAIAANVIAGLLAKWKWLNYIGLGLIFYVAINLIVKSITS